MSSMAKFSKGNSPWAWSGCLLVCRCVTDQLDGLEMGAKADTDWNMPGLRRNEISAP